MKLCCGSFALAFTCLAHTVLAADLAAIAVTPGEADVPVVCPAVHMPVSDTRSGPPIWEWRTPELVAVVRLIEEADPGEGNDSAAEGDDDSSVRYEVKRVLYGSHPGKTIRVESDGGRHWRGYSGDHLMAVVPRLHSHQAEFLVRYTLPLSEERAETALCQARLDYAALAAPCIFVGKQLSLDWKDGRENSLRERRSMVEVVRVIHGEALKPHTKVRMVGDAVMNSSDRSGRATFEPCIYFALPGEPVEGRKPFYCVYTHLGVDQEPKIREALGRRDEHPIRELEHDGQKIKYREITFRGTNAEAIGLLAAAHEGAVSLGYRTLMHRRESARSEVVATLEGKMLRMEPRARDEDDWIFLPLLRLVRLLGDMEDEDGGRDIAKLIEKYFAHIEQGAPEPPEPPEVRRIIRRPSEQTRTDVNRSFYWLLRQLGEDHSRREYGDRLLALRAKAKGRWKQEVQVALDGLQVEDSREVAKAAALMKGVRPVRSRSGLRHMQRNRIDLVAFSHDGKLLATAGYPAEICLWHTDTWTLATAIEQDGGINRLVFSPDDRFLYVAGGGPGLQIHARYDTRTGELDKAYEGHHSAIRAMELSPDGHTMMSGGHEIHFWDTETGKILRTVDELCGEVELFRSPDNSGVLRQTSRKKGQKWIFEPFRGDGSQEVSFPDVGASLRLVSSEGGMTYFVGVEKRRFSSAGPARVVWGEWKQGAFAGKGEEGTQIPVPDSNRLSFGDVAISPNGKLLAVPVDKTIWFLSLPELDVAAKVVYTYDTFTFRIKSVAFSPDGKLLAAGVGEPTPALIRTDTLQKYFPYDGHAGGEPDVFFTADGKQLRSYGPDGTVCTWDTATMKMLRRVVIPAEFEVISVREPDGRYAVCYDAAFQRPGFEGARVFLWHEWTNPARVFDAETGRIIAKVSLPIDRYRTRIHWIDDREALVAHDDGLCRFNYRQGKVLSTLTTEDVQRYGGDITEDGRSIFNLNGEMIDVATGKMTKRVTAQIRRGYIYGLVPGGKHVYFADPSEYTYDQNALDQLYKKIRLTTDVFSYSFSGDGRRIALATGEGIYVDSNLVFHDPKTQSIVRIHDSLSGETLFAFPSSTRFISVKLSPDGKRVAVVNDDGTIEIWPLPAEGG